MESILNKASQLSTLSFLRILHLCHNQTSQLVDDLKGQDAVFVSLRSTASNAELVTQTSGSGSVQSISTILENAMEELFVPYLEGQNYLDVEVKSLGELYSSYLARFNNYHVRVLPKT